MRCAGCSDSSGFSGRGAAKAPPLPRNSGRRRHSGVRRGDSGSGARRQRAARCRDGARRHGEPGCGAEPDRAVGGYGPCGRGARRAPAADRLAVGGLRSRTPFPERNSRRHPTRPRRPARRTPRPHRRRVRRHVSTPTPRTLRVPTVRALSLRGARAALHHPAGLLLHLLVEPRPVLRVAPLRVAHGRVLPFLRRAVGPPDRIARSG